MRPVNTEKSESRFLGSISASSMRNFLPRSMSSKQKLISTEAKAREFDSENIPPVDRNIQISQSPVPKELQGGNTKLAKTCAISPGNKNGCESISPVGVGHKVKCPKNEHAIDEIKEDDDNDLNDQIRGLKEELIRAKSHTYSSEGDKTKYFQGKNARESLNQLRVSLNRSLMHPRFDNESDEEADVDEAEVRELQLQLHRFHNSHEENSKGLSGIQLSSLEESFDTDMTMEDDMSCQEETEIVDKPSGKLSTKFNGDAADECVYVPNISSFTDPAAIGGRSISSCLRTLNIGEPPLSESPKFGNLTKKSMALSSESSKFMSDAPDQSHKQSKLANSSLQSRRLFSSPTESLAASLQKGLQIVGHNQQNATPNKSSVSFSFGHLTLKPCPEADKTNASIQKLLEGKTSQDTSPSLLCLSCQEKGYHNDWAETIKRKEELERVCIQQAAEIEQLNQLVEQYKYQTESYHLTGAGQQGSIKSLEGERDNNNVFDMNERESLIQEIESLRSKLQSYTNPAIKKSSENLRSSQLSRSIQVRKSGVACADGNTEELERERQRCMEMESDWISLTDELRVDLECRRQHAEKVEMELNLEKECTKELDDALHRAVLGHARIVEQFAELQEKYDEVVGKNRLMTEWIAEVKKAVLKAGSKGGSRFSKSLAKELSAIRVERERDREFLKKENKNLRIQLRDTAEAVHAAGELLVRLREAEEVTSVAEENLARLQEENESLKKQVEKLKEKHKTEMSAMKQYLAESRLPVSALPQPLYEEDSVMSQNTDTFTDDDQSWRTAFRAAYQEHF